LSSEASALNDAIDVVVILIAWNLVFLAEPLGSAVILAGVGFLEVHELSLLLGLAIESALKVEGVGETGAPEVLSVSLGITDLVAVGGRGDGDDTGSDDGLHLLCLKLLLL